jgi:hypothetical protein
MIWLNDDLQIAVQIVGRYPTRADKLRTIRVDDSEIKVIGVEDLIVNRIVAAKYWRSNAKMDVEQSTVLYRNFRDSLDEKYLEKLAFEKNIEDFLALILKKR